MPRRSDTGAVRTLRCRTVAAGSLRQINYIRDRRSPAPVADDPDRLSESAEPNGMEALLAAFGTCLVASIHANALARHISVSKLEVVLEGDVHTSAHWGSSDVHPNPVGFQTIKAIVSIDADASDVVLEALLKHAVLWSPVGNTLYNPVGLDVTLAERAPSTSQPSEASS